MSNIKLAFDRYLESRAVQRRALMLRWLAMGSNPGVAGNCSGFTLRLSSLIPSIISLPRLSIVKRQLRLLSKEFSTTTTRYFDNNFDILANRDNELIDKGEQMLQRVFSKCNHTPIEEQKDLIEPVFKWLYSNRLYQQCYNLIEAFPRLHVWFGPDLFPQLVQVIDSYGDARELFACYYAFRNSVKSLNDLRFLSRLRNSDPLVSSIVSLFEAETAAEVERHVDTLLESNSVIVDSQFNSLFTRICAAKVMMPDTCSPELVDKLINCRVPTQWVDYSLVRYLYDRSRTLLNFTYDQSYALVNHYTSDSNEDNSRLLYVVFKSAKCDRNRALYVWCKMYPSLKLDYNDCPPEFMVFRNHHFFTPGNYETFEKLDPELVDKQVLSRMFSVLIFGYAIFGGKSRHFAEKIIDLKTRVHGLPLSTSDKVGYVYSLVAQRKYREALKFVKKTGSSNDDEFMAQAAESISIASLRTKNWDTVKDANELLLSDKGMASVDQYATVFGELAFRGSTKQLLDLWKTFTATGLTPNDRILTSIIHCFIKTKSYAKALEWFSAYSYYKLDLSAESYALMFTALASSGDIDGCFKMLGELSEKNVKLTASEVRPLLRACSNVGNSESVRVALEKYYPMFDIPVRPTDQSYLLNAYYNAGRYKTVVEQFELLLADGKASYESALLALNSASRFTNVEPFFELWKTVKEHYGTQLGILAYEVYMAVVVRVRGAGPVFKELKRIKKKLKISVFPPSMFNEMIFSCIRMHRPWDSARLLRLMIDMGTQPSTKTYSLMLQSNVWNDRYAAEHIDETIRLLNEVLLNRKRDRLGKLAADLYPMSFKLVIRRLLMHRDPSVARKYFDLYVDNSKNYLLDDIHILHTELMLLGEEERWEEFSGCYDRFESILKTKVKYGRMMNDATKETVDENSNNFLNRVEQLQPSAPVNVKRSHYRSPVATLPNNLKKALVGIWPYRLNQLRAMGLMDEVLPAVKRMFKEGLLLSNKNLNETAVALSRETSLIQDTVEFINTFLLPGTISQGRRRVIRARYKTNHVPVESYPPPYSLDRASNNYGKILLNLDATLKEKLLPEQKRTLLESIEMSPNNTVLSDIQPFMDNFVKMMMQRNENRKSAGQFYRDQRKVALFDKRSRAAERRDDEIDKLCHYRKRIKRALDQKTEMWKKLAVAVENKHRRNLNYLPEIAAIKAEFEKINEDKKKARKKLREMMKARGRQKRIRYKRGVYWVGGMNVYKLHRFKRRMAPRDVAGATAGKNTV